MIGYRTCADEWDEYLCVGETIASQKAHRLCSATVKGFRENLVLPTDE